MSYDISIEVATGRDDETVSVEDFNYTSNVSPMWARALAAVGWEGGSFGELIDTHGRTPDGAQKVCQLCADAAAYMEANPAEFEAMNPPNGWGDADGARRILTDVAAALTGRTAIITVSR